jgi:hypothetical protein
VSDSKQNKFVMAVRNLAALAGPVSLILEIIQMLG